jgi:hypothetical protein
MAERAGSLTGLAPLELCDPAQLPAVADELPGIRSALDPAHMSRRIEDALLGGSSSGLSVISCEPGHATYLPGDCFLLRYDITISDRSGAANGAVVNGRLLSNQTAAEDYMRVHLDPLAHRASGHPALVAFTRTIASLQKPHMALSVWPIDGGLPALVDAGDARRVAPVLGRALGRDVRSCTVALGHYGRQHRCVLRYDADTVDPDGQRDRIVVYGKVAADGRGELGHAALDALRAPAARAGFRLPRSLGYVAGMRLLLLEAIPGRPELGALLKARVAGSKDAREPGPEVAIESAALLLARLHACGFDAGRRREAPAELAGVGRQVAALGRISPALGRRLEEARAEAETLLGSSPPLPLGFAHGDFSHSQIISDGDHRGVLDFDTVCVAEPALDVGHFLAYLRVTVLKAAADPSDGRSVADDLGQRFVRAYVAASGDAAGDVGRLRARAAGYEIVSLVRLGVHSWQKSKIARLANVMTILEERSTWI